VVVFGRPPGYDTSSDAIVRVAASEVRKRLSQHYGQPGIPAEFRISLPAGSYIPKIIHEAPPAPEQVSPAVDARIPGQGQEARSLADPQSRHTKGIVRVVLAAALLSGLSVASFVVVWNHIHRPVLLSVVPWSALFGSARLTEVITSDPNIAEIQGFTGGQISLSDYANHRYIPDPSRLTPEQLHFCQVILRGDKASAVDTPIAMAVAQLAQAASSKVSVRPARNIQFPDMQTDANFILLGSPRTNPWFNLYNGRLAFKFEYDLKTGKEVILNAQPRPGELPAYIETAPGWATGKSYAVVAFLKNLDQSGQVLLIAGQTAEGTEAAGKLVTDYPRLEGTLKGCGIKASGQGHFELLLQLNTLAGSPSDFSAVTCRVL
jgi:hypothetical protein